MLATVTVSRAPSARVSPAVRSPLLLSSLTFGAPLALLGLADADAKGKKKRKRKRRQRTPTPALLPPHHRDHQPRAAMTRSKNGTETDVDCGGSCPRCTKCPELPEPQRLPERVLSVGTCQACPDRGPQSVVTRTVPVCASRRRTATAAWREERECRTVRRVRVEPSTASASRRRS